MKKRRIKKIVKSLLNSVDAEGKVFANDGMDEFTTSPELQAEALASLNALADGDGLQANGGAGDDLLLSVLGISNPGTILETLNIDKDAGVGGDVEADAFPRDAREVADADGDEIGNNKEIHDAAILIAAERTAAGASGGPGEFFDIVTQAGNGAGEVDDLINTLETLVVNAGGEPANNGVPGFAAYETAYDNALNALNQLKSDIAAFKVRQSTVASLHASIVGFTPTAGVQYPTDPSNPATNKLVTASRTEAVRHAADFANDDQLAEVADRGNVDLLDLATEEEKVTNPMGGFDDRMSAFTAPADIPAP